MRELVPKLVSPSATAASHGSVLLDTSIIPQITQLTRSYLSKMWWIRICILKGYLFESQNYPEKGTDIELPTSLPGWLQLPGLS